VGLYSDFMIRQAVQFLFERQEQFKATEIGEKIWVSEVEQVLGALGKFCISLALDMNRKVA
jgi:hypothetical protein